MILTPRAVNSGLKPSFLRGRPKEQFRVRRFPCSPKSDAQSKPTVSSRLYIVHLFVCWLKFGYVLSTLRRLIRPLGDPIKLLLAVFPHGINRCGQGRRRSTVARGYMYIVTSTAFVCKCCHFSYSVSSNMKLVNDSTLASECLLCLSMESRTQ